MLSSLSVIQLENPVQATFYYQFTCNKVSPRCKEVVLYRNPQSTESASTDRFHSELSVLHNENFKLYVNVASVFTQTNKKLIHNLNKNYKILYSLSLTFNINTTRSNSNITTIIATSFLFNIYAINITT